MSLYSRRGVSAQKEEVHAAVSSLDQGLYPYAFCKIYPDHIGGDSDWVNIMHADGAGTKAILAYLYWKETGDISVWKGIAEDAIVMNLDDLLCTGVYNNILFSSTIDRNKLLIPGEILQAIIHGSQDFFERMKAFGVHIHYLGGETADVGDVVRTIAVNGTMTARWQKQQLITNDRIAPGDVIIGLASFGKTRYESAYNSGIGSNGLTSARHDMLSAYYAQNFPESFEPSLPADVVYKGPYRLTDPVPGLEEMDIGHLLLSPTRSFAPLITELLRDHPAIVHGMIHCSGGGQTKCLKYLPRPLHIIKDRLFDPPPVFKLIAEASGADDREMYQVFNMGTRLEIYVEEKDARVVLDLAASWGVEGRVIGRVEDAEVSSLDILLPNGNCTYT